MTFIFWLDANCENLNYTIAHDPFIKDSDICGNNTVLVINRA